MSEKHYPCSGGGFDRIVFDGDGSVWVRERTCKVERRDSLWGGYTEHCGACGADLGCDTRNSPQNYCPNCGAKVIGGDAE